MARTSSRALRQTEILAAALRLLRRGGMQQFSTAALAAEANCSKETLYNWFGDKQGILSALVEAQTEALNRTLEAALADPDHDARHRLEKATAALIDLMTGEASLAILRTAVTDASGELGAVLLEHSRERTGAAFSALIGQAQHEGVLGPGDAQQIFERLVALACGERQIRALLGDEAARPKGSAFEAEAARAVADLQRLFPS